MARLTGNPADTFRKGGKITRRRTVKQSTMVPAVAWIDEDGEHVIKLDTIGQAQAFRDSMEMRGIAARIIGTAV